jgi:hypothetical protein
MTLTEIEKQIIERISNRIIDDCVEDRHDSPSACIKDASIGVSYIVDTIHNLPKDHTLKPHLSKISEIANNIKEDTTKWAVLRGIM